ncbi:MAG: hypothetical protein IKD66_01085 [Solobacterium sp.]|nr:hypothetical protein [Solobacterium sp.]
MAIRTAADDLTEEIMSGFNEYCRRKHQASAPPDPAPSAEDARQEILNLYRIQAATKFGIPKNMVNRINGDTLEEIERDAEAFSELIRETSTPQHDAPLGNPDNQPPADMETVRRTVMQKTFGEALEDALNTPGDLWKRLDI